MSGRWRPRRRRGQGRALRLAAVWLALLVAGCSTASPPPAPAPAPRSGGTLRIATFGNIINLDPALTTDLQEIDITANVYDRLLSADDFGLGELIPQAARAFRLGDDGKSYTFDLRQDRFFADPLGRPLTAYDVKASLERAISPAISRHSGTLAAHLRGLLVGADAFTSGQALAVDGIQVLDDFTVRFQLTHPSPFFLPLLATPAASILPLEMQRRSPEQLQTRPLGSGPFVLSSRADGGVLLTPNTRSAHPPYLNEIRYVAVSGTADKDLIDGQLDLATVANYDYERRNPEILLLHQFYLSTEWLSLNTARPPLDSIDFRRAILLAVDNRTSEYGDNSRGQLAKGIIPRHMRGFDYSMAGTLRDPELAKAHLRAAGVGQPRALALSYLDYGRERPRMERLQAALAEVGISLQLRPYPHSRRAQYQTDLQSGNGDLFWVNWIAPNPHPYYLFHLFTSTNVGLTNYPRWRHAPYDQLVAQMARETNPERQDQLTQALHQMLLDQAVVVPLYSHRSLIGYRDTVQNLRIGSLPGMRLDRVWLAPNGTIPTPLH